VKKLLQSLAAIDQKLAEADISEGEQPEPLPPGTATTDLQKSGANVVQGNAPPQLLQSSDTSEDHTANEQSDDQLDLERVAALPVSSDAPLRQQTLPPLPELASGAAVATAPRDLPAYQRAPQEQRLVQPAKRQLQSLAAINQKLAEEDMPGADLLDQPEPLPGTAATNQAANAANDDIDDQLSLPDAPLPAEPSEQAPPQLPLLPLASSATPALRTRSHTFDRLPELPRAPLVTAGPPKWSHLPAHQQAFAVPPTPQQPLPELPRAPHQRHAHAALAVVQTNGRNNDADQHKLQIPVTSFQRMNYAAGNPNADVVHFGLYGKTFYGVDLKEQEYTIDSILTLRWVDARAISLLPSGQDELSLAGKDAAGKLWMPSVEITNRLDKSFDRISSSVTISRDGTVTKVERTLAVIKNRFFLNDYPFDKQTLRLDVASTQYMLNDVKLVPFEKNEFSGLRKGFFQGEEYVSDNVEIKASEEVDGSLQKSRGSMEIEVSRSLSRFTQSFLLPAILYLSISCAVFWLPFSPTFVTPRLVLSVFILLVFAQLAFTANAELPSGAPYNWVDLMCFTIQLQMFTVVCLNIFTEWAYHTMKCPITAVHISNELQIITPMLAMVSMTTIMAAGMTREGVMNLQAMTVLMPVLFLVFLLTYMTCCGSTLNAELARSQQREKNDRAAIW